VASVVDFGDQLKNNASFGLQGYRVGDVATSVILVDFPRPGMGPKLHRHPFAEVFVTIEGEATFTVGEEEIVVRAGQIAIAPPNTPHKFVSSGEGRLLQVDIHASSKFETEWLEE
jgi:mannose-6-phosphate isomerase-like protein (cupin superfamily)